MTQMVAPREAFGEALVALGERYEQVVVLEADISKSTYSALFGQTYPGRYFNVGVAEQNEVGMAAGMAAAGYVPFVCTFAVFASMRACEQVRTMIAYPRLNVKIAASNSGITGSGDGATHQAIEDLAIMRAIPNMTVIVPADGIQTKKAVEAAILHKGPVYLRLARVKLPLLYEEKYQFVIGKADLLVSGHDAAIIATGDLVWASLEAAKVLCKDSLHVAVVNMHTLKPIDEDMIVAMAEQTGAIITVEDHSVIGGLGGAVAETLVETLPVPMRRVGIGDVFTESGTYEDLINKYHLSVNDICCAVRETVDRKGKWGQQERERKIAVP